MYIKSSTYNLQAMKPCEISFGLLLIWNFNCYFHILVENIFKFSLHKYDLEHRNNLKLNRATFH